MSLVNISNNISKRKEVPIKVSGMIIGAFEAREKVSTICERYNVARRTVYNTMQRYRETGTTVTHRLKGPSRIFDERDLRVLRREIVKNRAASLDML
ncbi:hypothetical protein CLU79DRAFT_761463, partial [Phycomyces nitens]